MPTPEMGLADPQMATQYLVSRYCSAVDDGDASTMAELFVPGGQLIVYPSGTKPGLEGEPLRLWQGVEDFTRLIETLRRSYERWFHFLGGQWAETRGDEACGESYLLAHHLRSRAGVEEEEVAAIRYRDRFCRTSEGWRFVTRCVYRQWTTIRPVDNGSHEIDAALRAQTV